MESRTLKLSLVLFKYSLPCWLYSYCRHINTSVPKIFFWVVFRLKLTSETFALHLPLCLCSPSWLSNAHLLFPFFSFLRSGVLLLLPSPNLPFLLLLLLFHSTPLSLNVPFLENPDLMQQKPLDSPEETSRRPPGALEAVRPRRCYPHVSSLSLSIALPLTLVAL